MNTKWPAFTIIELIAVMMLSGIIFSAAMLVIQISLQQNLQQEKDHKEVLQLEQLKTLLKKDAYQSKEMLVEGKQLFFDYHDHVIKYDFRETFVLRSILEFKTHIDTFRLPTLQLETFWKQQLTSAGRIDALHWKSQFFVQDFELKLDKKYDHKLLMELELDSY